MDVLTIQWWLGGYVVEVPPEEPVEPPTDLDTSLPGGLDVLVADRRLLVYSTATDKWAVWHEAPITLFTDEFEDRITAGYGDGLVRTLNVNDADADEAGSDDLNLASEIETKDFWGGSRRTRKLFQWARINIDCTGGDATVELYVDGDLKRRVTVTGARTRNLIPFPDGCIGFRWRIRITTMRTDRPILYGVAAIYQTLRPA